MVKIQRACLFILVVIVSGVAGAAALPSTAVAKVQCNGTTKPCPLQKWMRDNVGTPMANGDLVAVANGIEKIQAFGPPDMKDWTKFAKKTVDDARANKTDDLKADCKTCHDAFRSAYKNDPALRRRPLP
jgi:hypothetical protein